MTRIFGWSEFLPRWPIPSCFIRILRIRSPSFFRFFRDICCSKNDISIFVLAFCGFARIFSIVCFVSWHRSRDRLFFLERLAWNASSFSCSAFVRSSGGLHSINSISVLLFTERLLDMAFFRERRSRTSALALYLGRMYVTSDAAGAVEAC